MLSWSYWLEHAKFQLHGRSKSSVSMLEWGKRSKIVDQILVLHKVRVRVILLSLGASVLAHPMRPTFAQMESKRKIKQMSKMEPLCIHSHDSRF